MSAGVGKVSRGPRQFVRDKRGGETSHQAKERAAQAYARATHALLRAWTPPRAPR